uniref:Small ribosomal subunit protein bS16m n=1 Tax=Sciurus vulgaris TaxID=55149 RepID=A0A8D2CQK7_SCIVU
MVHLKFINATLHCKAYRGSHLTICLALGGSAHKECPRDGRFMERVGSHNPLPHSHGEKLVALNLDRIRHWIGCGAHLSKPMEKLLSLSGFFPLHLVTITNAERCKEMRSKQAHELLLASQTTDTQATDTEAS